ncbi:MAG TPA: hypothetical protein PLV89_05490 [Treponemataceae bacterium]|jgi:hypothetical protein|nr:hypothetical protein [Treponemataceae bacterium]
MDKQNEMQADVRQMSEEEGYQGKAAELLFEQLGINKRLEMMTSIISSVTTLFECGSDEDEEN